MRRVQIKNENLCIDCAACELACSFHHTGSFWPSRASILIYRNNLTNERDITIFRTKNKERFGCDNCGLCVSFCQSGVLQYEYTEQSLC